MEVAEEFSLRYAEALTKVREALKERMAGLHVGGPATGMAEVLVDQLGMHATRVQLYFGADSLVDQFGGNAYVELRRALTADTIDEARAAFERSGHLRIQFMKATVAAVSLKRRRWLPRLVWRR